MNKPFTELPIPPKERMIITLYFTTTPADLTNCEIWHMSRVSFADKRRAPKACDVCGRLLCWACFGSEATIPGPDLSQVHICDGCAELDIKEVHAIIELRKKLNNT
jgi:hypothetical protein